MSMPATDAVLNRTLWRAVKEGDVHLLRASAPDAWLVANAESAAELARTRGHPGLAEYLRGSKARVLQTDVRAAELDKQLRESVARARESAKATAGKLLGAALQGLDGDRDGGGGIDPLRRMMRTESEGDMSTWRSSVSGASSHRSQGSHSSHRSHKSHRGHRSHRSSSRKGKRSKGKKGGGDDDDESEFSELLTEDEMLSELDDVLDAIGLDDDDLGLLQLEPPPPPPPKQLTLSDLGVRELKVLIGALGGAEEQTSTAVEKHELLELAATALGSAPLPLIDEVLTTLGLNNLQPMAAPPRRTIELHQLDAAQLRALITKLSGVPAPELDDVGELVPIARARIKEAPLPLLDEACLELQLEGAATSAPAKAGDVVDGPWAARHEARVAAAAADEASSSGLLSARWSDVSDWPEHLEELTKGAAASASGAASGASSDTKRRLARHAARLERLRASRSGDMLGASQLHPPAAGGVDFLEGGVDGGEARRRPASSSLPTMSAADGRGGSLGGGGWRPKEPSRPADRRRGDGSARGGGGAAAVSLFAGLTRSEAEPLSLETVAAKPPPPDSGLGQLSTRQLTGLLRKLRGSEAAAALAPPAAAATLTSAAAQRQTERLAELVRESMAEAPLALLDEVCAQIDAAAAAAALAVGTTTSKGAAAASKSAHGRARNRGEARPSPHRGASRGRSAPGLADASAGRAAAEAAKAAEAAEAADGPAQRSGSHRSGSHRSGSSASRAASSSAEAGAAPDDAHGRRRRRCERSSTAAASSPSHAAKGSSPRRGSAAAREATAAERRTARLERSVGRRLDEALDPDREAAEARRAARRLERSVERRMARALRDDPPPAADALLPADGAPESKEASLRPQHRVRSHSARGGKPHRRSESGKAHHSGNSMHRLEQQLSERLRAAGINADAAPAAAPIAVLAVS